MKIRIGSGRLSTKAQMAANGFAEIRDGSALVKAPRGRPEAAIQRAIKSRLMFHGIVCVAVPNEARRSAVLGRAMKAQGLLPGFPDLIVLGPNGAAAFLEVKAPDGRVSPAQAECHAMLERMGHRVAVVRSHEEAAETLRGWGWAC